MVGTVKKVFIAEGFAFIRCTDGQDRFVHKSSLLNGGVLDLVEEQTRVKGTPTPGKPGKDERLEDVTILDLDE